MFYCFSFSAYIRFFVKVVIATNVNISSVVIATNVNISSVVIATNVNISSVVIATNVNISNELIFLMFIEILITLVRGKVSITFCLHFEKS